MVQRCICSFGALAGSSSCVLVVIYPKFIIAVKLKYTSVYNLFATTQVQLAASQKLLVVGLLQFYNIYNVEVINGEYCCCDTAEPRICVDNLEYLTQKDCDPKCDTWFNISLSPCESAYLCSAATAAQCNSDPVHNLEYKFEFVMRKNLPDTVSISRYT